LITLPMVDLVERRRGGQVWQSSRPTYHSKILGPHFEETAREWARSFAMDETGLSLGTVGTAEVSDPAARTKHEIDVLALSLGERPQSPRTAIALIGEAKATIQPRGLKDLERLEHIRTLLATQGHRTGDAALALFSLHGFQRDVIDAAARRRDILLVDIGALYGDGVVRGL
ncbi:ATP-binding protein, partial [Streptomyces sp. MCAF7]